MIVAAATELSIDRLTALDRMMLGASRRWPQDIGALAVLTGGARTWLDLRLAGSKVGPAAVRSTDMVATGLNGRGPGTD